MKDQLFESNLSNTSRLNYKFHLHEISTKARKISAAMSFVTRLDRNNSPILFISSSGGSCHAQNEEICCITWNSAGNFQLQLY